MTLASSRTHTAHLADYLACSADRHPDRLAVVDPDGWSLTYRQLGECAARIAGFLAAHGIGRGDRVGLAMPKNATSVSVICGILRAGAAYVPVDPTAPAARCRSIFADCQISALFLSPRCTDILEGDDSGAIPSLVVVDDLADLGSGTTGAIDLNEVLLHEPIDSHLERDVHDLAYILYTSGSTGVPKGVMLTHHNGSSFVEWCSSMFAFGEHDRFSSHAPFHFDLSVFDLYVCFKQAGTLYVISEELGKDPKSLARFIADNRLTVWYSTPSILTMLAEFGELDQLDCGSLRTVLFAGEVFPVKHLRRIVELWPRAEYYNLYGPTETNVCTYARIPTPIPDDRTEPYPIGWPCTHCEALVLDDGHPVAGGAEGLLYIAGASVFEGYWNRAELNAHAFIERDGRRWYNTGDVVRLDPRDGYIYVGRRDRLVKRRGYRIELGEIESALYRNPDLREVAVVARPDADDGVAVVAFVVGNHDRRPTIIELNQFCATALPLYMRPDRFVFVDSLPRTSTDKVGYQTLLQLLEQPSRNGNSNGKVHHANGSLTRAVTDAGARRNGGSLTTPRDALEARLTQVWQDVLNVRPISITDNFFDLGGHSLLAVQLFTRIEALTGRKLPLETLLHAPTISRLGALLRNEGWSPPWSLLVPIQPSGHRRPFFCVHGFGGGVLDYAAIARGLDPEQPFYGIQARELAGEYPPARSVEEMASHYLREIRSFQPEGPYLLGGYSAGGDIAYELAQQLVRQGQEVALLALIDAQPRTEPLAGLRFVPADLPYFLQNLQGWFGDFTAMRPELMRARVRRKVRAIVAHAVQSLSGGKWSLRRDLGDVLDDVDSVPKDRREFLKAHMHALGAYITRPYPGKVTLFRASIQPLTGWHHRTLFWGVFARRGVDVHLVPGSHHNILKQPAVDILAQALDGCLEQVEARWPTIASTPVRL